jgi:hypothetical protein
MFEEEAEEGAPVDIIFVDEFKAPPFDVTDVVSKLSCVLQSFRIVMLAVVVVQVEMEI